MDAPESSQNRAGKDLEPLQLPTKMTSEQVKQLVDEIDRQMNVVKLGADSLRPDAKSTVIEHLTQQGAEYSQQLLELRKLLSCESRAIFEPVYRIATVRMT